MNKISNLIALVFIFSTLGCKTNSTTAAPTETKFEFKNKTNSSIHILEFNSLPVVGTNNGTPIYLGGFSGLEFQDERKGVLFFKVITDRGANGVAVDQHPTLGKNVRPFILPDFSPQLVNFELRDDKIVLGQQEYFYSTDGKRKISGLPPVQQTTANADLIEGAYKNGKILKADALGFDSEGLCTDRIGRTWVSDEYYPSIAVFDVNKKLIKRLTPGNGLPSVYGKRKPNRGFEGLTCTQDSVYAMMQSPIPLSNAKNDRAVRIIKININTLSAESQFIYLLDDKKIDKIGDITNDDQDNFYVIEQNGKTGAQAVQKIYKIQPNAFAITLEENPELWSPDIVKLKAVEKTLVMDLSNSETNRFEKLEGIAIHNNRIYIITDNDFGLDGDNGDPENPLVNSMKKPALIWFDLPN